MAVVDLGEVPGGARVPHYFWTKLKPEGPKKIFLETAPPPPYLRVWMTGLPLICRSGSATV